MSTFNKLSLLTIALLIVVYVFNWPWFFYVLIGLIWLIFTVIGSFHIKWNYHLNAKHSQASSTHEIALTFDDGPDENSTAQILSLLKEYNVKATFFCIGKQIAKHPELLRSIDKAGHEIGNHSYSHANGFGFFSSRKVKDELINTNELINRVQENRKITFRPPFGVTNPAIRKAVKHLEMDVVGWSLRSYDTLQRPPEKIFKRITKRLKPGDIVLLHDTHENTVTLLRLLLEYCQDKGLKSVTTSELLN